ncbi:uncharacterized protein LOC111029819, partial [Myzus persicae]|uniref:uncharacterized protein LOC111029819 n=1 Tax=Myzus persicae TaxID=13164 RepID=UPI000B93196A
MKSLIVVMISSIIIIAVLGNVANSQLDKELLGSGSSLVIFNKTNVDADTTRAIIADSGRRSKRIPARDDGGMGSIEWSLPISKTGNNVNGAKKEELTQVIAK